MGQPFHARCARSNTDRHNLKGETAMPDEMNSRRRLLQTTIAGVGSTVADIAAKSEPQQ
jgi:hypothetical protein